MKNLIVNTGSASKKYALYEGDVHLASVHFERDNGSFISTIKLDGGYEEKYAIIPRNYHDSIEHTISILKKKSLIKSKNDINKIGVRVVAPGTYFTENRKIDGEYLKSLKIAFKRAPLHIEPVLAEINKIGKIFQEIPMYGISDSEFHKDMREEAKLYGLPISFSKTHEIYRYGYHGISLQSIVNKLKDKGGLMEKVIVCHLGGGVSVCAIKNGMCVDTSMGFTPLEGMIMATRVGDIDSGALIYISEITGLRGLKLLEFLNHECGLIGLSNKKSSSVKELLDAESQNDFAKTALNIYAYKIQKQIGAYIAILGGVDKIVFTGTIGERSFKMRERILLPLEHFGINLDKKINDKTENNDVIISTVDSKVKVEVLRTEELKQMAKNLLNIK